MRLDSVARTHVHLVGRRRGAFHTVGWGGYLLAIPLTVGLSAASGRPVAVQLAVAAAAPPAFLAARALARPLLGRLVLVYYHHVILYLALAAAVSALAGAPVLAQLDVAAVGLALFTAVARVGCLMVGCCHGRPGRHGIAYGPEQVATGLPAYLVGVRLIPTQAFEAAGCAVLTVASAAMLLSGAAEGAALATFLCGYAVLRFPLEWLRGDLLRPELAGMSEAQWTSLAITLAVGVAGGGWWLVPAAWLLAASALTLAGRAPGRRALLAPRHIAELAARLERLTDSGPSGVATVVTSRGVRVSRGRVEETIHYTLSCEGRAHAAAEASRLAGALVWMRHPFARAQVVPGAADAAHVIVEG